MTYELIEAKRTKPRSAFQAVRRALSAVLCTAVLAGLAVVAVACLHGGFLGAITSPWMFQYLIAFCVAAALTLVCGARRTFLLGLIGILWTGALAVPAMIASPPTSRQGAASAVRCRVLDANVLYGNPPSEEALAWIADTDADVVVLVECSERWAAAMNKLTARYPHQLVRPANDPRGISLYSRHRISAQAVRRAPAGVLPFLDVIVHLPDAEVRVVAVHPVAPSSPRAVTSRNAELAWLAEQCAATELPLIVTGDFNETPYGAA
ncbi:MAG: endonuclease/exonuclease/phosphatase family protein, partial [Phycisphaerae bacterium]|nr:endonuclease/exonuclease/phosphatase family protein [Phycisphaerae bacterium]